MRFACIALLVVYIISSLVWNLPVCHFHILAYHMKLKFFSMDHSHIDCSGALKSVGIGTKTRLHFMQSFIVQMDVFVCVLCLCEECSCLAPSLIDRSLISFRCCVTVGRVFLFAFDAWGCRCGGGYNCGGCFQHGCIILMHALHVPANVHFLLGTIHTKWTLKLWIFAAFPFLMVAQWRFQFIHTATIGGRARVATTRLLTTTIRWSIGIAAVRRTTIMSRLHEWNERKIGFFFFGFKFITNIGGRMTIFAEFVRFYFIFLCCLTLKTYQDWMKCAISIRNMSSWDINLISLLLFQLTTLSQARFGANFTYGR